MSLFCWPIIIIYYPTKIQQQQGQHAAAHSTYLRFLTHMDESTLKSDHQINTRIHSLYIYTNIYTYTHGHTCTRTILYSETL